MLFNRLSLNFRFSLTIGALLLIFCALFSTILYYYLKAQVIKDSEEKTMIIMTNIKAVGEYVKESLRPRMTEILASSQLKNEFIVEAMSTTHINTQVMQRFNRQTGIPCLCEASDLGNALPAVPRQSGDRPERNNRSIRQNR